MDESGDGSSMNEIPIDQAPNITASTDYSGAKNVAYAEGEKYAPRGKFLHLSIFGHDC